MSDKATLSTGKYTIELNSGATMVYKIDDLGNKVWFCSTTDPSAAMDIVEGLILVEYKRFYHPEAAPKVTSSVAPAQEAPQPPFLKRV